MWRQYLSLFLFWMITLLGAEAQVVRPTFLEGSRAHALIPHAVQIRLGNADHKPDFIRFAEGFEKTEREAIEIFREQLNFKQTDDFVLMNVEKDPIGQTHKRYQQTYNGLLVEGAMMIVHFNERGVYAINGDVYAGIEANMWPSITEPTALTIALEKVNAKVYMFDREVEHRHSLGHNHEHMLEDVYAKPKAKQVLVPLGGEFQQGGTPFRLAYKFDIYAAEPLSRTYTYVDAHEGTVIWQMNRLHSADEQGTAVTRYSGSQFIVTDNTGSAYRLQETGRGGGVETYNVQNTVDYANAVDFLDDDNFWNNVNAAKDEVAPDAHWASEMMYDYLLNSFGRNSLDDAGMPLISYVHFDSSYVNAFWNGTAATYGDGGAGGANGSYGPLTCVDIVAHELAHGLTQFTCGLIYQDESGALNESFSDIWGTVIEHTFRANDADWEIAADIGVTPFRSMENPNLYGHPSTYLGLDWFTGTSDNGGVHTNSGVQNYWFYLVVEGDSGTNDLGDTYNVTGIGMEKAAAIAYRTQSVYLTFSSQYVDAEFYSKVATMDLYGPCADEIAAVTNAWYAVGIGPIYSPTVVSEFVSSSTANCKVPLTVDFTNLSVNAASFTWDFGDGTTSTQVSPSHTYSAYGDYTVTLTSVGGSCGTVIETKVDLIQLDPGNECLISMESFNIESIPACTGSLYDPGGPNADYIDGDFSIFTIEPPDAAFVTLTFSEFEFMTGEDFLYIYDGADTLSTLIGAYSGNLLPNGGVINSSAGAITVFLRTLPGSVRDGFALTWQCTYPDKPPVADFIVDTVQICAGLVQFMDMSADYPNAWLWDFGDGMTSTDQNPLHEYTQNGTYTVSLVVSNSQGGDSLIQTNLIVVNRPDEPIVEGDTICGITSVDLTATASGQVNWYSATGQFLSSGNTFTTPTLNSTTVYYVENEIPQAPDFLGPPDFTYGPGGFFYAPQHYLEFDVFQPSTLAAVTVFTTTAETRTIELRNANGTVLQSKSVWVNAGVARVELDFALTPGVDYQLGLASGSTVDLYRNIQNTTYPYEVQGLVSITGCSGASSQYYYFYNWEVESVSCKSRRVPVTVEQYPSLVAGFQVAQNLNNVSFNDLSVNATSWEWEFGDGGSSSLQNPTHTYMAAGVYTVTQTVRFLNCEDVYTTTVQVDQVSAIEPELFGAELQLFPNPGKDVLNVWLKSAEVREVEVSLYNIVGEKLLTTSPIRGAELSQQLDISMLPSGTYLVKVQVNDRAVYKKYIKE